MTAGGTGALAAPVGRASLGMYPLAEVRWAFDELWRGVAAALDWVPSALDWELELPAVWEDPELVVGQTCGWPLVTHLRDRVRVLGTFAPGLPDDAGSDATGTAPHCYRSVLVAREPAALGAFASRTAAVNGPDSLSGWVSLVAAVVGPGGTWPGSVRWTGAHLESLREVRDGAADVASIDAVTFELARRHRPALVEGLVVVGRGPAVPALPLVTVADRSDAAVAELQAALAGAVRAAPAAAEAACVAAFVPLAFADYEPLLELASRR